MASSYTSVEIRLALRRFSFLIILHLNFKTLRYDKDYEENGQDYPVGFVRWTEQRNFEAVLDMMAEGRINVEPLISHRFNLREAEAAYAVVSSTEPSMGILLEYSTREEKSDVAVREPTVHLAAQKSLKSKRQEPSIAFIGSGNYASGVLIPAFKEAGAYLASVASAGGVSGMHAGKKYGFDETTTDTSKLFKDPNVDALVITTRHDSHARFVLQALEAGKHLFVEKPLCVTLEELNEIELVYTRLEEQDRAPLVMVGFNRRFSPHLQKIKSLLTEVSGPKSFVMTVNAGEIPSDHWVQDAKIGGGRIIGEGCHFIDLLRFLADCPIITRSRAAMNSAPSDTMSLQLGFADGSIGTVHYFANGCKSFPKERLEVFAAGRVLQMDNFRKLRGFGWPKFSKFNLWSQNKGQRACAAAFIHAIRDGTIAPIPFAEMVEVTRVSIDLATAP